MGIPILGGNDEGSLPIDVAPLVMVGSLDQSPAVGKIFSCRKLWLYYPVAIAVDKSPVSVLLNRCPSILKASGIRKLWGNDKGSFLADVSILAIGFHQCQALLKRIHFFKLWFNSNISLFIDISTGTQHIYRS